MLNNYLNLHFEVIEKAENSRYTNGDDIRLVIPAPIALITIFKLLTSSGKHPKVISQAHIVSLIYKLITSAKDSVDLPTRFDTDLNRRRNELANNKNIKGKFHVRIILIDVFGIAKGQEKASYGLGYKITKSRKKDEAAFPQNCGISKC